MIRNISIATADDVTYFGDDVKSYTLYFYSGQLPFRDAVFIG